MFTKRNLFAALVLSASFASANAFAQDKTAPKQPEIIERNVQIIGMDGESYLGVELQEVSKENFEKLGLKEVRGAAVRKVADGSPAKKAGIAEGDVVIKFNGEEITGVRKLRRIIGETAPDHQAKITVLRNGSERELTATLGKRATPAFQNGSILEQMYGLPGIPEFPSRSPNFPRVPPSVEGSGLENMMIIGGGRRIGISAVALNKELGEYFGVSDGRGVLISNINADSPAAKAGLKSGDVILEADGKAVAEPTDLNRIFNDSSKKTFELKIVRNKNRQTITVEPTLPEKSTGYFQMAPNS